MTDKKPPLSLDDWLDGYACPEDTVSLIAPSPERARHSELEAELQALQDSDEKDPRMGGGMTSRRAEIAREIKELEAAAKAAGREFQVRVRGLTQQETIDLRKSLADDDGGDDSEEMNLRLLMQAAVEPTLNREQAERLRATLTPGQWSMLVSRVANLTFAERVDVPFSLAASVTLATEAS